MKEQQPRSGNNARWLFAGVAIVTVGVVPACGGDDDSPAPTPVATPTPPPTTTPTPPPAMPADATAMAARLTTDMGRSVTRLGALEAGALFAMSPGSPLAPNMAVAPDASSGSPPNTFTFKGAFDGNANGQDETTLDGRVTFAADPTDFFAGFTSAQGSAAVDVNILGLMHVYDGDIAFTIGMAEHRMSGGGAFTNPLTGVTTSMTVNPAAPLTVKLADGSANARANACAHSLNGSAQVNAVGSAGTLASTWRFAYDSSTVAISGVTFTDSAGRSTPLPDSQLDLGCAGTNSIDDWNGRFRVQWACVPFESGEFNTTISVKNATTLSMLDDGATAADVYEASVIGSSPRAIRGFFNGGPVGSRYREDFNWTLNLDSGGFSQSSRYVYFEGAQAGRGGLCAARATRIS